MNNTLESLKERLENSWNETDQKLFDGYKAAEDCRAYLRANCKTRHDYQVCYWGPYSFHEENAKHAKKFCEGLEAKVKDSVGEIVSWSIDGTEQSLWSYTVVGTLGKVKVSQIFAGGYNIVRLHIRNIIRKIA